MPERLMSQHARDRSPRQCLAATTPTPRIRHGYPTLDHRPIWLQTLTHSDQTKLIQPAERGQIRAGEGSLVHGEASQQMAV